MTAQEFRGNLYVFVDREVNHVIPADEDSLFNQRAPGQSLWYLTGYAVSRNPRGTYCARTSISKLRSFTTFIEAMDLVRQKRKARPQDGFHLVYEAEGRKSIVTSLAQIRQLDEQVDPVRTGHAVGPAMLDVLTEKVGKIVAANALALHTLITQEGEEVARSRFSNATYERLSRVLRECRIGES